jgi:RNA polymerase sigma-70 factor, ECF subfamily
MSTHIGALDRVRLEADRLQLRTEHAGFRRRRAPATPHTPDSLLINVVARARQGDEHALRYLYLHYRDNVYGYVCSIVRDEHDAEDVTQQIFIRLPTSLMRYEPRVVPFLGWILRVAHNAAIDHVRLRRPLPVEEVRPASEPDNDDSRERFRDLREALDTLPTDQRTVIVMRLVQGLTPTEVAERLGRTEDAIHGLQHRARRALKAELLRLQAGPSLAAA